MGADYKAKLLLFILATALAASVAAVAGRGSDQAAAAVRPQHAPFALPGPVAPAAPDAPAVVPSTNCRYGVSFIREAQYSDWWIPTLGAGWYGTFTVYDTDQPAAQFVPIIRLRQDFRDGVRLPTYTFSPSLEKLAPVIRNHPGALWLVGNEVEIDNFRQDNIMPDLYAHAYHEAYHFVKGIDPTALVGIGSVTMGTPGRLQYLDIVLDTYEQTYGLQMPIDVWNIHLYILAERTLYGNNYADGKIALGTDPELAFKSSASDPLKCPPPGLPDIPENDPRPDVYCKAEYDSVRIFREQVYNVREWMKERGYRDRPLIISEFGQLSSYTNPMPNCSCEHPQDEFGRCMCPERVTAYLQDTVEFLENAVDPELGYAADDYRLVQRWMWYSIMTPYRIGYSSNLLVPDYAEFPLGSDAALGPVGRAFQELAQSPAGVTNLVAGESSRIALAVGGPLDRTNATISAAFRNEGERSVGVPFTVSFFADEALTQLIGFALVNPDETGPVAGCRWLEPDYEVEIAWFDLPVGVHPYWARIDSSLSVAESDESDNVTTNGLVTVYVAGSLTFEQYVPLTRR